MKRVQKLWWRRSSYLLLLALQTLGAALVFANGIPVYRRMAGDFSSHQPYSGVLWWAAAGVGLIQVAYWVRVRLRPALPWGGHVLIGHVALFVARLSFILASSSFALIFFVRFEQLSLPPRRILIILALLFSLFCYALELEGLAKSLQGNIEKR